MSDLKFESINDNDTNNMKNLKGAAPLRYFSQDEILKKEQQPTRYSAVGNMGTNGPKVQNSEVDRWQSSNLNELQTYNTFQINQPFIGSQHTNLKNIGESSKLRSFGEPRLSKKQQLVTEQGFGRNNFIAPDVKKSTNNFIVQDNNFINGYSNKVPNFNTLGNNPIYVNKQGLSTRNDNIETIINNQFSTY